MKNPIPYSVPKYSEKKRTAAAIPRLILIVENSPGITAGSTIYLKELLCPPPVA
jgi:hypothetical protein